MITDDPGNPDAPGVHDLSKDWKVIIAMFGVAMILNMVTETVKYEVRKHKRKRLPWYRRIFKGK